MQAATTLHEEQWAGILRYVAETYSEVTLSRGFHFYKQGMVDSLRLSDYGLLEARVEEFGEKCRVELDVNRPTIAACSCPAARGCKHMAAALMALGDRYGYPASQVVNAKIHLKRMAAKAAEGSGAEKLPGLPVSGWQQFLDGYTQGIKPSYDQGRYVEELRIRLESLQQTTMAFSAADKLYWELHQQLFILRKLAEQQHELSVTFYTSSTIYWVLDHLNQWLELPEHQQGLTQDSKRLEDTLAYLRQGIERESDKRNQHFIVYTAICAGVAERLPAQEQERLAQTEAAALVQISEANANLSSVAAHAYVLTWLGHSDEAWKKLALHPSFETASSSVYQPFLAFFTIHRHWADLADWLRQLTPFFARKRLDELNTLIAYWKLAAEHLPQAEDAMWRALETLLPLSYRVIESLLHEQGKWKLWIELQIMQGHSPLEHRVSVLQPIEKESPELLLPYYHQAIEQYVRLKNRHDYKAAVKLLKRLDKVYKKMKQPERWDAFFAGFVQRHSRLRALQEELKKGKLLE
ncbi:hypothetical protein [Paenibacillus ferrarius]|uniref:hypothetical protein n=1 Tax=Paenibacillus ferrarius TaxID=1469647 RepID=UPI003D2D0334